jgi:hypothetical protein
MPLWPSRAKKSRKKQPVAPPDAPPYREVTSGRKQELDQEATPGRRNFFHSSYRSDSIYKDPGPVPKAEQRLSRYMALLGGVLTATSWSPDSNEDVSLFLGLVPLNTSLPICSVAGVNPSTVE